MSGQTLLLHEGEYNDEENAQLRVTNKKNSTSVEIPEARDYFESPIMGGGL